MSRKEFLTPLQEQWALPFELRPSGGSQSLRVSGEGVGFAGAGGLTALENSALHLAASERLDTRCTARGDDAR